MVSDAHTSLNSVSRIFTKFVWGILVYDGVNSCIIGRPVNARLGFTSYEALHRFHGILRPAHGPWVSVDHMLSLDSTNG